MNAWVLKNKELINQLKNRKVTCWIGHEMAILEKGTNNRPQFSHDAVPCLQLCPLYLELDGRQWVKFITYETMKLGGYGICLENNVALDEMQIQSFPDSIFRTRELEELPVGTIESVSIDLDDEQEIFQVVIGIAERKIYLLAGEIEEGSDKKISFVFGDESILLFQNVEDIKRIKNL